MNDAALQQEPVVPAIPEIAGARPLRNPAHERYARARSLLVPRVEAYRDAGLGGEDYHADRGNAAKLERKQATLDRIAFLTRQPEEVLAAKRARIEAFLWAAHETNYADFWTTRTIDILDDDGEPTGETKTVQDLRLFSELAPEQQRMIQSLKFTERGRPILEIYSSMEANKELRKLLGLGSADREDGDEFGKLTDVDLFAEIMREAKELGINAEFTFKAHGASAA